MQFGRQYGFGLEAGSKPELLAVAAMASNDTPIICNGFKDAEFIEMAMLAQKIGPQHHPGRREVHRARADPEVRGEDRRAAAHRHAREAGRPRHGPLAVVGRLPLEVRPDRHRDPARAGAAQGARHGGLLQAAPLPPRQPDHQHPHHQERAERSGARLLRSRQGRRGPRVHRRRRRAGRRLRRLADQLRVEHELHAAGVRQRRRLPRPAGVRRRAGAAPDDHLRERPRHHGLSLACSSSTCSARADSARSRCRRRRPTTSSSRSSTSSRPSRTSTPATRSRATTTPSRRSTWR